ncbi:MAG: acyl-CoA dehydrogenase [Streptosporangiales bacterium]|nr:acyl-CoA dehydrogenase [Streptosporangiales bacterium]
MDFTLDETQGAVAGLAAEVLRREVDYGRAERSLAGGPGYDETLWKAMAHAGLLALAVPEDLGGEGLGVLETALVLAEVGRHAAAVPALATLGLGVLPLSRLGTGEQRGELLPPVVEGDAVLTAALNEPSSPLSATPATTAREADGGYLVGGVKVGVPYATSAHRILVPAMVEPSGTGVLLVDPKAAGVDLRRTPTSSGAPEYRIRLDDAWVPAADLLGGDTTGAVAAGLRRLAVAGGCAVADGALDGALALTAAHVRTREQFGRPLAAFQAVAQQVADVYVTARTLHLAAWSACWRLAAGRDTDGDLDVAALWAAEQATSALHTCHHLHGGLGMDASYPLHRHYSLVKDLARFLGGVEASLDRLGEWTAKGSIGCSSS